MKYIIFEIFIKEKIVEKATVQNSEEI
jgi:hypothetical protein